MKSEFVDFDAPVRLGEAARNPLKKSQLAPLWMPRARVTEPGWGRNVRLRFVCNLWRTSCRRPSQRHTTHCPTSTDCATRLDGPFHRLSDYRPQTYLSYITAPAMKLRRRRSPFPAPARSLPRHRTLQQTLQNRVSFEHMMCPVFMVQKYTMRFVFRGTSIMI